MVALYIHGDINYNSTYKKSINIRSVLIQICVLQDKENSATTVELFFPTLTLRFWSDFMQHWKGKLSGQSLFHRSEYNDVTGEAY